MSMKAHYFTAILLALMGLSTTLGAQDGPTQAAETRYKALGIRLLNGYQLSYKARKNAHSAIEITAGFAGLERFGSKKPLSASAVYQYHYPLDIGGKTPGLAAYTGTGLIVTYYRPEENLSRTEEKAGAVAPGIQLYAGLEYRLPSWPVTVSVDWAPVWYYWIGTGYLSGINESYFYEDKFGLSIRYVF